MLSLRGVEMTESLKLYHSTDGTMKGLIFNHDEKKVVGNFPTPTELSLPSQVEEFNQTKLQYPIIAYGSIESTLIRVYHFDDEWHLSTSSKIDAYQSSWAEKDSFGIQFEQIVENISGTPFDVFLNSLDPSIKYFFLLPTRGLNRLGKRPEEETNEIYLVGIELEDGTIKHGNKFDLERNLWSFLDEYTITSYEELLDLVCKQQKNIIIYDSDRLIKCISDEYKQRCELRNNEVDVQIRYIQLLQTDPEKCKAFVKLYPKENFFSEIDHYLNLIVVFIHKSYMKRYVKKEYVKIPKHYYQIMKTCHQQYLSSFEKTTFPKVWKIIMDQEPKNILSLIRNFPQNE